VGPFGEEFNFVPVPGRCYGMEMNVEKTKVMRI
jgi:hypothetical protein